MSVQLEGLAGRTADSFVHRRIYGRSRVACAPVGRQSAPNGAVSSGLERQRRTAQEGAKPAAGAGFGLIQRKRAMGLEPTTLSLGS
jgi:hypothetical protein